MREPVVAGRFYEGWEKGLRRQIENCYRHNLGPGALPTVKEGAPSSPVGWVVPHAGYMYSGPIAAHSYSDMASRGVPPTVIVFGTQHHMTRTVAVTLEDHLTPIGVCRVDPELTSAVAKGPIEVNDYVHMGEHSLEVQLPFLLHLRPDVRIVPIAVGMIDHATAAEVGRIVRAAFKGKPIVAVASTDMTHHDFVSTATKKDIEWLAARDRLAIDRILALDPKGLHDVVIDKGITMCGMPPVMAMMETVQPTRASLLKYACSAEVAPSDYVVGYASIRVEH
jgi:AmmeMemoRadiSam system protein B